MNIEWFKQELAPKLTGYEMTYRLYSEGDFGALSQVVLESEKIGSDVDFWGLGWLGVFLFNYETEQELLNILLNPNQVEEQERVLQQLLEYLL